MNNKILALMAVLAMAHSGSSLTLGSTWLPRHGVTISTGGTPQALTSHPGRRERRVVALSKSKEEEEAEAAAKKERFDQEEARIAALRAELEAKLELKKKEEEARLAAESAGEEGERELTAPPPDLAPACST